MMHYTGWLIQNPPFLIFNGIATSPPSLSLFRLLNQTQFLLLDGTNFLLLGN